MRYPASEKAEIIRLVEQSHLPAKRTLEMLGIPSATFCRWYDRYRDGGPEALADHRSRPDRVWNRIPDEVRRQIIDLALELPELSPRELAVRFTDEKKYRLGGIGLPRQINRAVGKKSITRTKIAPLANVHPMPDLGM